MSGRVTPEAARPIPPRLAVDANGYVWRVYADHWPMAPSNPDNEPVPQPVTFYEPVGDKSGRDASAADLDGAAQARGHHESVGERQGRQPAPMTDLPVARPPHEALTTTEGET